MSICRGRFIGKFDPVSQEKADCSLFKLEYSSCCSGFDVFLLFYVCWLWALSALVVCLGPIDNNILLVRVFLVASPNFTHQNS
jgi:hypothetical protein